MLHVNIKKDDRPASVAGSTPQSVIIRIWLEPFSHSTRPIWRAHMTHVPSGRSEYARRPRDVLLFVVLQLQAMGANLPFPWRLLLWLRRHFNTKPA